MAWVVDWVFDGVVVVAWLVDWVFLWGSGGGLGGGLGFLMVGGGWQFCNGLFLFGRRENTERERGRNK